MQEGAPPPLSPLLWVDARKSRRPSDLPDVSEVFCPGPGREKRLAFWLWCLPKSLRLGLPFEDTKPGAVHASGGGWTPTRHEMNGKPANIHIVGNRWFLGWFRSSLFDTGPLGTGLLGDLPGSWRCRQGSVGRIGRWPSGCLANKVLATSPTNQLANPKGPVISYPMIL